ncbi:GNAT family N-acetyltransferase [Pedobacter steynii]|uniref:GNAT family N-acetyltransferase n=1 Tax=Pedobacter steynii TaxID=430522 RepID=A0A1D7QND9_9SPHI|nr:GNAT family N-acetyltransferase [Pedobacter steynii]AOM80181.1 GNAT family N-acetyltransferase [Pedobacter steynii]
MLIKYADSDSFKWLAEVEKHITSETLLDKINNRQILIAAVEGREIAYLRFGYFWDNIPFMNLLFVEEDYRKQGVGKRLAEYWESEMCKLGHSLVLTSTLSNEEAQHFYRKLGYQDAGGFTLPGEALEIILVKVISAG